MYQIHLETLMRFLHGHERNYREYFVYNEGRGKERRKKEFGGDIYRGRIWWS